LGIYYLWQSKSHQQKELYAGNHKIELVRRMSLYCLPALAWPAALAVALTLTPGFAAVAVDFISLASLTAVLVVAAVVCFTLAPAACVVAVAPFVSTVAVAVVEDPVEEEVVADELFPFACTLAFVLVLTVAPVFPFTLLAVVAAVVADWSAVVAVLLTAVCVAVATLSAALLATAVLVLAAMVLLVADFTPRFTCAKLV
jgi:hypothetical protein